MLASKVFVFNPVQENTYLIWDVATREGAVIDCGAWTTSERKELHDFITTEGIILRYALQTHTHFDHIMGLPYLKSQYGISPVCHDRDMEIYNSAEEMIRDWFQMPLPEPMPPVMKTICDNEIIRLGESSLQVIHTPGHTPGGVCFYCQVQNILFSGDTLFFHSMGRTDLPGGSYREEVDSIKKRLLVLPEQTVVYPGHGPESTIAEERSAWLYQ